MEHRGSMKAAEDLAIKEAKTTGIRLGIALAAVYVERRGDAAMAAELRSARIVEGEAAEAVEGK
jgi:hypothetical protein